MHHHACYADRAWHGRVEIQQNAVLAQDTYRIRIGAAEIARRIVPGQFLMLRLPGCNDPLLGRPLALYDTVVDPGGAAVGLDIVYLAIGKMTRRLATLGAGDCLEVWGPLGNGFPAVATDHLVMVAGGIGQTPFLALARESLGLRSFGDPPRKAAAAKKVTLCYGVRAAALLAGVDDFMRLGVDVRVSTDDGSCGHRGLVTEEIAPAIAQSGMASRLVCCGPEPMLKAAAKVARQLGVPCHVSLESPMACGIGICFSCVAKVRDDSGAWDYRRTCVEGPVFDAEQIEF